VLRGRAPRERLPGVTILPFYVLLTLSGIAPVQGAAPAIASYVAVSVSGGKLPSRDKVSDADGTQYVVEFDELVLAIRPGMQFRAALRYRQTLALKGAAIERDPIQRMTVYGRYEVHGNMLRFIPDPKRGGKGIQILDGTFAPGRIDVPFFYRNGQVSRKAQVVLKRDDSRF
jgi:hypothetical protein